MCTQFLHSFALKEKHQTVGQEFAPAGELCVIHLYPDDPSFLPREFHISYLQRDEEPSGNHQGGFTSVSRQIIG
jgi:hypothetical protein